MFRSLGFLEHFILGGSGDSASRLVLGIIEFSRGVCGHYALK